MHKESYLKLQPSETAVAHMASRIFSAYITSGQLTEANEEELMNRSIFLAKKLAIKTDKLIDSDNESSE